MQFNIGGRLIDLDVDDSVASQLKRAIRAEESKQISRTRSTPTRFSSLQQDNRKVTIINTVCPHCGGDFVPVRSQSSIEIGYCTKCRDDLVRDTGLVYGMFSGSCGFRKIEPVYTPIEPTITENIPTQPPARIISKRELFGAMEEYARQGAYYNEFQKEKSS